MDMAGRTGADTAAIAVDARYIIEERRLACGFALGNFDFPPRSIAGYERHFDHHTLRISASANQRACSRTGRLVIPRTRFEKRRSRSEEHTSELQSLMRISYAVFCLKKNIR